MQQDHPSPSPLLELLVVSTLNKCDEEKERLSSISSRCDDQSQEEKLNSPVWQVPLPRDQGPSLVPALIPLPETQCRRCQSGPGSGSCCPSPGRHSSGFPGRLWSVLVGPAPVQRSGSGSRCGCSSRSWAPLGMDGRGELEALRAGSLTPPPTFFKPLAKGWWVENRGPESEWFICSPTRTYLHVFLHLTPLGYELRAGTIPTSQSPLSPELER